jgi:hypothetical protein
VKALTMAPDEAKKIKEIVTKFLLAVHGQAVGSIDFDEMKREQDKITLHGSYQIRSRLARSRSVTFKMELDNDNHLLSYVRETIA